MPFEHTWCLIYMQAMKGAKAPQRRRKLNAMIVLGLNLGLVGAAIIGNVLVVRMCWW